METNYEIYVKKTGESRWSLDSQYGGHEKERAVTDAKRLEQQSYIEAVRVIRENYHPETNETKEFTVYSTSAGKTKRLAPEPGGEPDFGGGGGGGGAHEDEDDGGGGEEATGRARGLFRRRGKSKPAAAEAGAAAGDAATTAAAAAAAAARPRKGGRAVVPKLAVVLLMSIGFAAVVTVGFVFMFG